jgi:hypothetical protein
MTDFEGPVDTGNPHAKRPLDKKQGDANFDQAANKDKGSVFPSGKVAEEIEALFAGVEGLSEDFTMKASTLVEGVLSARIETLREEIEAEYNTKLDEQIAEIQESYYDKLDSYLNYVCENYMTENKLAIEEGIKSEFAEQILESVVSIVEANGLDLPKDKIDVAEALTQEVVDGEKRLNEEIEKNVALTEKVRKFELKEAFANVSSGLSEASKDKLQKLAENISYKDVADYTARVTILKESLTETQKPNTIVESLVEQVQQPVVVESNTLTDRQKAYLAAMGSYTVKK